MGKTYEYRWVHEDRLNEESEDGWRVVPGILSGNSETVEFVLMERERSA